MRVVIKARKVADNIVDIYALAANGDTQQLARYMIPMDGDFVADTDTAKAIIMTLQKRWKDIF